MTTDELKQQREKALWVADQCTNQLAAREIEMTTRVEKLTIIAYTPDGKGLSVNLYPGKNTEAFSNIMRSLEAFADEA